MKQPVRYLQNVIGVRKPISYKKVAEVFGMTRENAYIRLKKPFTEWEIGDVIKIAELLGYGIAEIGNLTVLAIEYEEAIEFTNKPRKKGQGRKRESTGIVSGSAKTGLQQSPRSEPVPAS